MSSQCKLPCLPPPPYPGQAADADTCPSHCAVVEPDACPVQDVHPCPCQGAATCPDACPQEPCIPETVGTCKENNPLQYQISSVEPCKKEPCKKEPCKKEPCCAQEVITGDPCPDQCSVPCMDPCTPQSTICTEPCVSQSVAEPTEPCAPQGTAGPADTSSTKGMAKGASSSPQAPFRLNTRTAAIVERCLSRCQIWLRRKKQEWHP